MNETALITVRQLPEIQENLRALRDRWEQKAKDAESMVCTEETVQAIKKMRSEMRKEYEEADRQRKAAKAMYLAPWNAVEDTFKECISDAFKGADASYKATIDEFEDELKKRCRDDLESYFLEMCFVHNISDLNFETAMRIGHIKINLSEAKKQTPRQLQDAIAAVVAGYADDLDRIQRMDNSAEILAEYKNTYSLGTAITTVLERKRKIEAEAEAQNARIRQNSANQAVISKVVAVSTPQPKETDVKTAFSREIEDIIFPEFTFTVFNVSKPQLIGIREFLKQEEIQYE